MVPPQCRSPSNMIGGVDSISPSPDSSRKAEKIAAATESEDRRPSEASALAPASAPTDAAPPK